MEKVGETEMIQTFHNDGDVHSATSARRGQEVRTANWSSYGAHNWLGFQEIRSHAESVQLIIGCPMCVMFCQLQNLSLLNENEQRMWVESKKHVEFMCEIYAEPARYHRLFVHEHPADGSWRR